LRRLIAVPALRVRFISEDELRVWDPQLRSFTNLNTPEEYTQATAVWRELAGS
jgi:hypothetical protein